MNLGRTMDYMLLIKLCLLQNGINGITTSSARTITLEPLVQWAVGVWAPNEFTGTL